MRLRYSPIRSPRILSFGRALSSISASPGSTVMHIVGIDPVPVGKAEAVTILTVSVPEAFLPACSAVRCGVSPVMIRISALCAAAQAEDGGAADHSGTVPYGEPARGRSEGSSSAPCCPACFAPEPAVPEFVHSQHIARIPQFIQRRKLSADMPGLGVDSLTAAEDHILPREEPSARRRAFSR